MTEWADIIMKIFNKKSKSPIVQMLRETHSTKIDLPRSGKGDIAVVRDKNLIHLYYV